MIPPFQTTFAVPLSCEACIKDVSTSLHALPGITSVSADLSTQLVSITGTASPTSIVATIEATGRDAILRGSGASNSAAVCILESHAPGLENKVRGLVRMVEVAPTFTVVDLSMRGVSPGTYHATVRERGDISEGPESTGPVWEMEKVRREGGKARGVFGTVEVNKGGIGTVFLDRPVQVWEIIGRSIVVSRKAEGAFDKNDPDTLVGVIARSAGVWDNDKTVCSCSGKTVWEERKEQVDRGML
ncbi:superoxide dismutase copper chaperone-like protein [Saccharata proteae CBS 121410]|uniref:Superoxide dismutase 1 copper chaperone n=1 Tax=Saccharata proteae CBS 121410 TaxID=1314787 RepID=A0A9P4HVF6_9PEZI|nr:superoxide dismutase copper chaperone-like protein [Saccharata proteae CBS 121410]